MLILAGWLGCPSREVDPELEKTARSLASWEEGRKRLEAGDAAGARASFREAAALRPSPLLIAWEAEAAAAAGDLEGAVATLDQALAAHPTFGEARYNRAAYLARLGRAEAAAEELRIALDQGAARSLSVLEDPDFTAFLDQPAFSFLPQDAMSLAIEPPPATAFWGAEIALRLRLLGIVRPPATVTASKAEGPLELVAAVEDTVDTSQGIGLDLSWTWRVAGAGPIAIGPFVASAGRYTATADAISAMASAPPGKAVPSLDPLALTTPSEWLARIPAGTAAVLDERLVVRAAPTDRVTTEPPLPPPVRYERRERGQPVDLALRWPRGAMASEVRIVDPRGGVVFQGPPTR